MTISYHDTNLFHNFITRRSVTGVIHVLNKNPIDCCSKKQSTIEIETCGSEYLSARTCVEQILYLRITLQYLGAPIRKLSCMFGGNDSAFNSSMTPQGNIHKSIASLYFYRVREAIAAKIASYYFISGKINPADNLSKHRAHHCVWPTLKPLLFWNGDTMECLENSTLEFEE